MPHLVAPDVIVLAAGGIAGEAWMTGVLAGIEDASGLRLADAEAFVGTSAGSIVAARLAAGIAPRRPPGRKRGGVDASRGADSADAGALRALADEAVRWGLALSAPAAAPLAALAAPGGALARRALLAAAPRDGERLTGLGAAIDDAGARFDGRLRICCVDRASGRRTVFGAPGAPAANVGDAVAASCAIPWRFAPVQIGGRLYVDGGVWSLANLDAAPARRGTEVLCLDVSAGRRGAVWAPARAAVAFERQQLLARGARVRHIGPDADAVEAIGPSLMASASRARTLAAGYAQGLALGRNGHPRPAGR